MFPSHRKSPVVYLGLVFAVVLAWASPAAAASATATPVNVAQGATVTVVAGGFKPGSSVDVAINRFESGSSVTANGAGQATASIVVSATARPGINRAKLQGIDLAGAARSASAVYTVMAADSAPAAAGGPPGSQGSATLPRTGTMALLLGAVGLLAIAGGGVLVLRSRPSPQVMAAVAVLVALIFSGLTLRPTPARAAGTGTIQGTVTSGGTGVAGICVHAASGQKFGQAITNSTGAYTITVPTPATYSVAFADCNTDPTYFTQYVGGSPDFPGIGLPVADSETKMVNATMVQGGTMVGRVTDEGTGTGLGSVCVRAGITTDTATCLAQTGANGVFAMEPISAGTYTVLFQGPETHAVRYYLDKDDPSSATPVNVVTGSTKLGIDQKLPVAATISGSVTDSGTGAAPTQRRVCVGDFRSDIATLVSSQVATDGTFTLPQLAPGAHKVKFFDCGGTGGSSYTEQFFAAKATIGSADPIPLTAGQQRTGVNAAMSTGGLPTATTTTTVAGATTTTTIAGATTTTTVAGGSVTTIPAGPAASSGPVVLSASTLSPGDQLTLTGDGFAPGSNVDAFVFSTPVRLGRGVADPDGRIRLSVRLPDDLTAGSHTVQLHGVDPQGRTRVLSSLITVRARGPLPATGMESDRLLALGSVTLGLGLLLALVARRRRTPGSVGLLS